MGYTGLFVSYRLTSAEITWPRPFRSLTTEDKMESKPEREDRSRQTQTGIGMGGPPDSLAHTRALTEQKAGAAAARGRSRGGMGRHRAQPAGPRPRPRRARPRPP